MFTLKHVFQSDKLEGGKKLAAIQIGGKFNKTHLMKLSLIHPFMIADALEAYKFQYRLSQTVISWSFSFRLLLFVQIHSRGRQEIY